MNTSHALRRSRRRAGIASACAIAAAACFAVDARANTYYWDLNGPTAGAGGTVVSGTWDNVTANWNVASGGGFPAGPATATTTWENNGGHNPWFAAGSDATGASTVTISGTQNVWNAVTFEEGTWTLNGGQINLNYGWAEIAGVAARTINSTIGGMGAMRKTGTGTLTLTGTNTYAGPTMLEAGTLNFNGSAALSSGPIYLLNTATLQWAAGNTSDITQRRVVFASPVILATNTTTLDVGANNVTFANGIEAASIGAITKAGSGTLTLNGVNKYMGDTRIAAGSIVLGNANALQFSAVDMNSADSGVLDFGALTSATLGGLKGSRGLALQNASTAPIALSVGGNNGSNTFAPGTATYTGTISGAGSLIKVGSGTQVLSGDNTYSGATTVSAGTLSLSYTTLNGSKLSASAPLNLGAGALAITGNATAATSQTVNGLNLLAGASGLVAVTTSGQNATLAVGAIARGAGATVDFTRTQTAGGVASVTTTNPAGRLPAWATVNKADWATVTGGNIEAITGYVSNPGSPTAADDVDVITSYSPPAASSFNSLRFNTTAEDITVALSGANTIASGGILVTPAVSNWFSRVSGGTITSGTSELVVQQHNPYVGVGSPAIFGDLAIDSQITGAIGLTKAGAGLLALEASNDYTGATTIAGGTLQIGNGGTSGSIPSAAIVNNGILGIYRTDATYTVTADISGNGGIDIGNEFTRTTNNMGRITLAGNNTYTGTTRIWKGTLVVDNPARVGPGVLEPKGNAGIGSIELSGNINLPNPIRLNGRGTEVAGGINPNSSTVPPALFVNAGGNNTLSGDITVTTGGAYYGFSSLAGSLTVRGNYYIPGNNSRWLQLGAPGDPVGGNGTYAGIIADGAGAAGVIKYGAGTWTLTGQSTGHQYTAIWDGVLKVGVKDAISPTSVVRFQSGTGTLDVTGFSSTVGAIHSDTATGGSGTVLLPTGSTLVFSSTIAGGDGTFEGQIVGGGTVIRGGTRTQRFTADQVSFTGNTIINSGNLYFGNNTAAGSLPGPITINGGLLGIARTDATYTLPNDLSGLGMVQKEGSNTLEFSGANSSFAGTVFVRGGLVRLTGNQIGAGILNAEGAAVTSEVRLDHATGFTANAGVLFSGRNTANLTPAIHNVSGNNTLSGPISITTGGNAVYLLQVDSGSKLTFAGDLVSAPDNARNLRITGQGDFEFSGGIKIGTITQEGSGIATLSGGSNNTYSGGTNVSSGTLRIGANNSVPAASALNVTGGAFSLNGFDDTVASIAGTGGTIALTPGNTLATAGAANTSFSATLSGTGGFTKGGTSRLTIPAGSPTSKIGPLNVTGGQIDLVSNKFVTSSPVGTPTAGNYDGVSGLVQDGRNGGAWDGVGVVTSMSDASAANMLTTLAVAQASAVGYGGTVTFGGHSVAANDTLIMYTYAGDANLDGVIDGDDYFNIDSGFQQTWSGYANGDFDYSGSIDADDYWLIDRNFSRSLPPLSPALAAGAPAGVTAVPEPGSLAMISLAAGALMRRRRR